MPSEPTYRNPRIGSSISHDCIDLHALSGRQQRLIERHMPLVSLALRRHFRRRDYSYGRRDLHQDGCIALAECIRNHEPQRHGAFEPYAIARVRFAVSRTLRESGLVRVPFSTQRRAQERSQMDRLGPSVRTKTILMTDKQLGFLYSIRKYGKSSAGTVDSGRITLGEMVRDCCDFAIQKTVDGLASDKMRDDAALLAHCAEQRWSVPDESFRRTYRELADDLECAKTRIVRREREVFRRTARRLQRNRQFRAAMRLVRSTRAGLRHVPDADELRVIGSMNESG